MTRYQLTGSVTAIARSPLHDVHARSDELTGSLDAVVEGGDLDLIAAYLELPADAFTSDNPLATREIARRLDARRHPLVRATVDPVTGPLGRRHPVRGELTLHGVCQPLAGGATVTAGPDGALHVDGAVRLDIRRFGLRAPSMLGLRVRPEVDVRLRIVALPDE